MAVHVQTCEIYALNPLVIMLDFPFLRSGMGGISTLSGSRFGRTLSIQHYSRQALRAGIRQRQLTEICAKLNTGLPSFNTHQPVALRIRFRCGHLQTSDEDSPQLHWPQTYSPESAVSTPRYSNHCCCTLQAPRL